MFQFLALALLAVSCSGYPTDQGFTGGDVSKQYRVGVEEYLGTSLHGRFDNYDGRKVRFFLYTGQEPHRVELKTNDLLQALRNSTYDVKRPVKILIHDWLFSENFYTELISAYLRHLHKPVNVITVDYSHFAASDYKAFMNVYQEIGMTLGKLVEELHEYGTPGDKVHIIGHGVGAHIAAVVAHKISPYQIGRITGLDPAGLEFDENKNLPQLQKHDADFVDVISTNMGEVGSSQHHRGHVTFFPNGGVSQPRSTMFQSHLKAYLYFVESVARGKVFQSYAADSYNDFKSGKYHHSKMNHMGEYCLKNVTGEFYLDVNPYPPFSTTHDDQFQPNKIKIYETYYGYIPRKNIHPWEFTAEEEEAFKHVDIGRATMGVVEGQKLPYAKVPLTYSNVPPMPVKY